MKTMKFSAIMMALATVFTLGFTSCSDDDDNMPAAPVVKLSEVGLKNSKHAHPGHDLHLEGTIVAEGLIKRIDVEIHQEDGGKMKIEKSFTEGKYINVRNAEFHEHIDIPAETPLGEYHLHFTVTDNHGQQTTVEEHLNIVEDDGTEEEEGHEHHHHHD